VVAEGTSQPIFQFIPIGSITVVPDQIISAECVLPSGAPFRSCQHLPLDVNQTGVHGLAWNWSVDSTTNEMGPGDVWTTSFLVYASGPPFATVPVDACTMLFCKAAGSSSVHGLFTWALYSHGAGSAVVEQSFPIGTVAVENAPRTYPVTFSEHGLPPGTNWSVVFYGTTQTSNSTTISLVEPNGTYPYSVGAVGRYVGSPGSGNVTVRGTNQYVSVAFNLTYMVTFQERGLPKGTGWWVDLTGGAANFSTTGTQSIREPNGTYLWTAAALNQSYVPIGGSVTVNGAPATMMLSFGRYPLLAGLYPVDFVEYGLPLGTSWTVTFYGTEERDVVGDVGLAFHFVANGSYAFSVGPVPGYTAAPGHGTIVVNGTTVVQNISFQPVTQPAKFLGLPASGGYALLGGIVVAIVALAAVILILRRR